MMIGNTSLEDTNHTNFQNLDALDFEQFLNKDIPAVVFLTIVSIVGTVGNVHTLLVYSLSNKMAKLAIRTLIIWLSATDLIACVFCIPFEIFDIRYSYTFSSAGACKFFRFLNHAVTFASGGLLTAIAIERYSINAKRLPRTNVKPSFVMNIVSAIVVFISVSLSIPAFVFYGLNIKVTNIEGLTGTDCTILSQYQNVKTAGVYTGFVILLSSVCCLICFFVYGKILYIIFIQIKKEHKHKEKSNNYRMEASSDISSRETNQVSTSQVGEVSPKQDSRQNDVNSSVKSTKSSKYAKGRRLTVSLIVATAVSYLGYIIYASTILVKIANPTLYNKSIRPATAILLRAYFINNAANPVVFCFIDKTFRAECQKLYHKTYCGKKCMNS